MNPYLFFININKWLETPRDKKQKLFAKYIDFITIDKIDKEINITGGNFRESFLADMRTNMEYLITLIYLKMIMVIHFV